MRSPEKVLNSLTEHSEDSNYRFERLYRTLFNEEMFHVAYQRIYAKPGNMTQGADGKTIDRMSLTRIENLIGSLKDESYQPQPSRRVYIPKKNGKMRPLGVPAFDDKLVQEVVRMILEAIYEGYFENTSHGFRPKRSCRTALTQIQKTFCGAKWFVEGGMKGFFDNINHEILINTLKERISDDRFIRLIRKFLNAGYVEAWKFQNTYSGTPQGGYCQSNTGKYIPRQIRQVYERVHGKLRQGERAETG
jgi:group II intron reverse transcriptase/maturase